MDYQTKNQNSRAATKLSRLDWPTPDILQAAKRARGKALRDMILALVKWAKDYTTNYPILRSSRDTVNTDALPLFPKR